MPGRQYSSNSYRYGFNGKENDNETVGTGSGTQDYGMRIYNPALGRFLSVDPLANKFPWWSPYAFAGNTPIQAIDLDGGEILNYKTPFRLRLGKEGLQNNKEIGASYSEDAYEASQMLATATDVSYGLASKTYNMDMPTNIPLKPGTGEDQTYFTITPDEQQQLDFFGIDNPGPDFSDASSNATDGAAADRSPGQRYVRTNTNKTINDRAGAIAGGLQGAMTYLFKQSNTMRSVNAKSDLNTMIKAYADATNIVENFFDFSAVGKGMNWSDKQVEQFKVDIINFVVDGKLPNSQTVEYNKAIETNGQMIINNVKEADAQKPLLSDDN